MNFVCIVFELGDKMLKLSSNSAMQPKEQLMRLTLSLKIMILSGNYSSFSWRHSLLNYIRAPSL